MLRKKLYMHAVIRRHLFVYRLDYNSGRYSDSTGVTITAADFGDISSVEILDLENKQPYFKDFVEYFVERGYVKNVNIRAAPYDWRLAPGYYVI